MQLGVSRERIVRIPPGVDAQYFAPGIKAEEPLLIFFGGMRRYKRPEHAVEAFGAVAKRLPGAHLLMVGDGVALTTAMRAAERYGLSGRVEFLGRVSSAALRELLSRAWVNIHTSTAEGFGYSIVEACAAGVPTAAYRVPGVSGTVADGLNGLLATDGDPLELGERIYQLCQKRALFSNSARSSVAAMSWEASVQAWETHLDSVARTRIARRARQAVR